MDDDISIFEKYQLAQKYQNRDPKDRYAPDKNDPPKRDKGDKKDKDKKNKKDEKPNITTKRVLVRNEDGTMGVQFIDVNTGRVIQNPFGERKKEISAGDFDDVFGKRKKTKSSKEDKDEGYNPELNPGFLGYDKDGNAMFDPDRYVDPRGSNQFSASQSSRMSSDSFASPSAAAKSSAKSGTPASNNDEGNDEQGDRSDSMSFAEVDASTDYGLYDPQSTQGTVGRQNLIEGMASRAKEDANFATLDGADWDVNEGNNFHSMDGVAHKDINTAASSRNWDQATIDKAARTLAGELAGDVDLSTPEGQREARAILSTIENRDIANGAEEDAIDAMTAPSQYSTWNDEAGARIANANFSLKADQYTKAVQDYLKDPNSNLGFTSYHAPYVNPAWSDDMQDVQNIGDHKFGTLPEYTSKIAKQMAPMTDEQSDQVATDQINQNFEQSFAAPAGDYISSTTPEIDTTGVQTSPSIDGFAQGYAAQRDYLAPAAVQQIKEDLTVQGPLSTVGPKDIVAEINNQVAMDNGMAIQQGNQIAGTPPTVPAPEMEVASRSITGIEDGFVTQPSITADQFNDRFSAPVVTDTTASEFNDRFSAPPVDITTASEFGDRFSAPTMAAPDKAMGFGDFVSVSPTAAISPTEAATQTGRINGIFENDNVGMLDAANSIANTAPSVAETANAFSSVDTGVTGDPTSAGSGVTSSSVSTGTSSGPEGGFASASTGGDSSSTTSASADAGVSGTTADTDTDSEFGGSDGFL